MYNYYEVFCIEMIELLEFKYFGLKKGDKGMEVMI